MNSRKLTLPLLVALACIGTGATVLPATAATKSAPHKSHAKVGKLRIDAVRVATQAGPLTIRVAADARTEVRMTVNGKRVSTPFEFAGPKAQQVELRSVDGLRAGSNKLRITARRAGVVSKAARSVTVPAWALLADAGEDAGTPTHVRARVGTAAAPGAGGGTVDYSWDIVSGPRGADARIADPDAPRPVLDTRDPGTYVLQEEADPEADGVPTAADQVTVAVAPNDPPIGVPIDTLGDNGVIVIGDKTYGGGSGSSYVVLERTTRTVVESGSVPYGSAGLAKLNDLAANYGGGRNYMRYLMIVNGRYGAPADQLDGFASLLKKLGAAPPTVDDVASLKLQAAYSVIGIPGAPAGAATTWIPSPSTIHGSLTGYLQVEPGPRRRRDAALRIRLRRTACLRHQSRWQRRHDRRDGHRREDLHRHAAGRDDRRPACRCPQQHDAATDQRPGAGDERNRQLSQLAVGGRRGAGKGGRRSRWPDRLRADDRQTRGGRPRVAEDRRLAGPARRQSGARQRSRRDDGIRPRLPRRERRSTRRSEHRLRPRPVRSPEPAAGAPGRDPGPAPGPRTSCPTSPAPRRRSPPKAA